MTGPSLSEEADRHYRPLEGLGPWRQAPLDHSTWDAGVARLGAAQAEAADWAGLVLGRGCALASAYGSAALAGGPAEEATVRDLLGGTTPASGAAAEPGEVAHLLALAAALDVATGAGPVDEDSILAVHRVACAPQATHPVETALGRQDHVLAHGEYKHHANHERPAAGGWLATAPVAVVGREMAGLVAALAGAGAGAVHPVVRAAYVLRGLDHVRPFAAGNGRVARALAGAALRAGGGVPFLVRPGQAEAYRAALAAARTGRPGDLVAFVARSHAALVETVLAIRDEAGRPGPVSSALARWRRRRDAAAAVAADLPGAVDAALARWHDRDRAPWQADLARVDLTPAPDGSGVVLTTATRGTPVAEVISIDPESVLVDDDAVVVNARGADLHLHLAVGPTGTAPGGAMVAPLPAWLDRVVMALAIAAAAAEE